MKSGDKYTFHAVEGGDAALLGAAMNAQIEIFYLPLCYIELGLWHLICPIGSAISETKATGPDNFARDFAEIQLLSSKTGVTEFVLMKALAGFFTSHTNAAVNLDTNSLVRLGDLAYGYSQLLLEQRREKEAVAMLEYILQTHPVPDIERRVRVEAAELYMLLAEKELGEERTRYIERAKTLVGNTLW